MSHLALTRDTPRNKITRWKGKAKHTKTHWERTVERAWPKSKDSEPISGKGAGRSWAQKMIAGEDRGRRGLGVSRLQHSQRCCGCLQPISYHVEFEPHDKESPIEHLRECFAHNSTRTGPMPMNRALFESKKMPQQSYLKKLGLVGTLYVHSAARVYLTGLKMF